MNHIPTLIPPRLPSVRICSRTARRLGSLALVVVAGTLAVPRPAAAVDGCLVLLCFAAPSWKAIPQCVAPVKQVLHDLAHGKPFPSCGMAGAGNSASHAWANAPTFCPPQYMQAWDAESTLLYSCDYNGAVSVVIDGAVFARTWWNMGGATVTDFSPEAKAQLGTWDTQFDDDYAAWLAEQPPAPPPAPPMDGA